MAAAQAAALDGDGLVVLVVLVDVVDVDDGGVCADTDDPMPKALIAMTLEASIT